MKNRNKVLIVMLAAVMTFAAALPVYAAAENDTARIKPSSEKVLQEITSKDVFAFRGGKTLKKLQNEAKNYPDSFDLRNVDTDGDNIADSSFVTPVKAQNPFGTCWGFGTIAAAESSILSDKKLNDGLFSTSLDQRYTRANTDSDGRQILDLSEKQIAYFANTYLNDPDDPQNGEGIHFRNVSKNDEHSSAYKYDTGGTPYMATSLLASGTGASFESGDPDDILGYHGLNSDRNLWNVATHYDIDTDKPVPESYARKPVWYSSDDDWSIPDEYRFVQNYSLKESIVMPDPAGSDKAGAYQYNEDAIRAIKQQLYDDHRAVCVSFCAESYLPGQDTSDKLYMSDKWAHYTFDEQYSNHTVAIVGWDDNYPAANFLKTPVDEKGSVVNGAFLIKNSWGSELNEFPNNAYRHWGLREGLDGIPYDPEAKAFSDRATGYFWISYADRSLNDPEAFIFEEVPDDAVYYIEQLDYMYPTGFIGECFDGARSSNVLQAKTTSMLNAISVITGTPDTEVSYELYLLGDSYDGPEDGIKAGYGKASFSYGGYHKVTLEKPVALTKGQKFSIVVRMTEPDGTDYICHSADYDTGRNYYNVGILNPGESYMYYDGKWLDFSEPSTQDIIEAEYRSMDLILDNFPIKAYLEPIKYQDGSEKEIFSGYLTIYNWQDESPGTFKIATDETKTLAAEFRGIRKDMPDSWNPVITWESLDESVFTVTQQENDNGRADIRGIAQGSALLKVDVGEYGVRMINIVVSDPVPPEKKENTMTAKGKSLSVKGTAMKHTISRAKAYTIKDPVGTLTFKKTNKKGGSKITVNKTSGKITVKKGIKKGTYKVKVKIKASGNKEYKAGSQTVTVTIKVK